MCILEKLNFKIIWGSMPPDPPSVLGAWPSFCQTNSELLACYYQLVVLSIILHILITQKDVSFFSRKGCTFRIKQNRDIYFKDCWHEVRSSLKCTPPPPKRLRATPPPPPPPPKKLRTRLAQAWSLKKRKRQQTNDKKICSKDNLSEENT